MKIRPLLVLLAPMFLLACSKRWTHPDYTSELFQKDNVACEDSALEMTRKGSRRREKELYANCMQGKGWSSTFLGNALS